MATWLNVNSQDSSSPLMEQLAFFHDHAMMILVMITLIVSYVMVMLFSYVMIMLFKNSYTHRFLLEGQTTELIWTIAPAITLIFIALPSLRLLYLLDEINFPLLTVKSIGHRWYWSYELSDFKTIEFDSYMTPINETKKNKKEQKYMSVSSQTQGSSSIQTFKPNAPTGNSVSSNHSNSTDHTTMSNIDSNVGKKLYS